jgi:hypothetical protein
VVGEEVDKNHNSFTDALFNATFERDNATAEAEDQHLRQPQDAREGGEESKQHVNVDGDVGENEHQLEEEEENGTDEIVIDQKHQVQFHTLKTEWEIFWC